MCSTSSSWRAARSRCASYRGISRGGLTSPRRGGGRTGARAPALGAVVEADPPEPAVAAALRVEQPHPLDGTSDGFDTSEPLRLELEDQDRRSEEPYDGPEDFSGVAYAGWDDAALY